jgi:hypothetical protein
VRCPGPAFGWPRATLLDAAGPTFQVYAPVRGNAVTVRGATSLSGSFMSSNVGGIWIESGAIAGDLLQIKVTGVL